jgi:type IV secretory pathway protease TraF
MIRNQIKRLMRFVVAPLAALAVFGVVIHATGPIAIVNETPSLPRGLYVRTAESISHGAVVAFAQPPQARAYLETLGYPEGAYLLKRVVALVGERVDVRALPRLPADRRGTALPQAKATLILGSSEMFVLGDTGARSFDSRYFGPLPIGDAVGVYRLVWAW